MVCAYMLTVCVRAVSSNLSLMQRRRTKKRNIERSRRDEWAVGIRLGHTRIAHMHWSGIYRFKFGSDIHAFRTEVSSGCIGRSECMGSAASYAIELHQYPRLRSPRSLLNLPALLASLRRLRRSLLLFCRFRSLFTGKHAPQRPLHLCQLSLFVLFDQPADARE